jgi:hypothetical protein
VDEIGFTWQRVVRFALVDAIYVKGAQPLPVRASFSSLLISE